MKLPVFKSEPTKFTFLHLKKVKILLMRALHFFVFNYKLKNIDKR